VVWIPRHGSRRITYPELCVRHTRSSRIRQAAGRQWGNSLPLVQPPPNLILKQEFPVLVTGAQGLLGSAVTSELRSRSVKTTSWTRADADLSNTTDLTTALEGTNWAAIVHCAAWTNVDSAEDSAETCRIINVESTRALAIKAAEMKVPFVYVSSGGVFDGCKRDAYDEKDEPAPLNVYHRSKYEGERTAADAHPSPLITRVGWLYGGGPQQPKNFVAARLRQAEGEVMIQASQQQSGSPTWVCDAARSIVDLLDAGRTGLCHVANEGCATRFDYVTAILQFAGSSTRVEPAPPGSFRRKAHVPANESLTSIQLPAWGISPLRPWRDALREYLNETETGLL